MSELWKDTPTKGHVVRAEVNPIGPTLGATVTVVEMLCGATSPSI